jgi:hypothetical protein
MRCQQERLDICYQPNAVRVHLRNILLGIRKAVFIPGKDVADFRFRLCNGVPGTHLVRRARDAVFLQLLRKLQQTNVRRRLIDHRVLVSAGDISVCPPRHKQREPNKFGIGLDYILDRLADKQVLL